MLNDYIDDDRIAILGMSCRFPGARDLDEYRELLRAGKSVFSPVDRQDAIENGIPDSQIDKKDYVCLGVPFDDLFSYDSVLANLNKDHVRKIDPQFYHLWECVWEALENANCGFTQHDMRVGIFAGSDTSWYSAKQVENTKLWDPMEDWDNFLLNDSHFISTWLSYKYGFKGPSIGVQTACSTSLTAVHVACNALIAGDCDIAIAGGVSIRGPQQTGYLYRTGGILSPSGICRPFDIKSDGTVLSSGVGVVVMSRYGDAVQKKMPVLANIIGSAINNDGDTKVAFTAPNGHAQVSLVKEAIQISGTALDSIEYIETHGTGTELGDAIEVQSLYQVFHQVPFGKIHIGSCKANFGHLESAAGIAGLIKAVLSVSNNEIYPLANFTAPNPKLQLETTPFVIPTELKNYINKKVRRAGVSSFGIGGTNVHVLVESVSSDSPNKMSDDQFWPVFGISAMSPKSGDRLFNRLQEQIANEPDSVILTGATVMAHRKPLTYRKAIPFPPGSGARFVPMLSDAEFVKSSQQSAGLTLSFGELFIPGLLDRLSDANARLKAIITTHISLAKSLNVYKNDRPWIRGAIIAVSLTEWIIKLGLTIEKVRGLFADPVSRWLHSGKSLSGCLKEICSQSEDNTTIISGQTAAIFTINNIGLSLFPQRDIGYQLADMFCRLWTEGYNICWINYFPLFQPIRLPAYPFERVPINRTNYEMKTDHIRQYLVQLWEELLNYSSDECDDFFNAGGDSLSLMKLASRINNDLLMDILMEDIYENPTFEGILRLIEDRAKPDNPTNYPLSANQAALYSYCALLPNSPVYNVYACFELSGPLNIDILYRSFETALHHQDVFRTAFIWDDTNVVQQVKKDCSAFSWKYISDLLDESHASHVINQHIRTIFDLTSPPLLSVLLIRRDPNLFDLSVVSHHLVSDEWSAQALIKQVILAYNQFYCNQQATLPEFEISYGEYVLQKQAQRSSQLSLHRLQFWETYLKEFMPFENKQPSIGQAIASSEGDMIFFDLTAVIYSKVKNLARQLKTTPFVVLLSAFNILIYRYTSQSDICIGINLSNRSDNRLEHLAGYFTNTLPIRIDITHSDDFAAVVRNCHKGVLDVQQNQLPLSQIIEVLPVIKKNMWRSFFDTVFVLQNVPRHRDSFKDISLKKLPYHNGTAKFNLEFVLEPKDQDSLAGMVEFKTSKFDRKTVSNMIQHFKVLLKNGLETPNKPVSLLQMITAEEQKKTLHNFNALVLDHYRKALDFWKLFEHYATSAPNAPAIITADDKIISYEELLGLSQALGNRVLTILETNQQNCVAILCERSEDTALALLAVQACRLAFILLDPNLPTRRIADIIHDSEIEIIIVSTDKVKWVQRIIGSQPRHFVSLDNLSPVDVIERQIPPSQLAYIMYTSGSTGKPKGALITRTGMMNHLHEKVRTVELKPGKRVAQTASLSFDISIWQFLAPLMSGAALVIFSDDQIFDIDLYLTRIEAQHCDVVELVPSYLETIFQVIEVTPPHFNALKCLMSTGEALPTALCNKWLSIYPHIPIINAYGPTECADDVLQHIIDKPQPEHLLIPAGIPLANIQIFILDADMQPVPPEVIGDIYVGGIGVGLGYLKDQARTNECFLPNPFSNDKNASIYRTGDLGAWTHDGSVVYLGRLDTQIKINGARVELAEIDTVLNQCPQIRQAVSVYDPALNTIAVFCIPCKHPLDVQAIKLYSLSHLPSFMCPSVFKTLDLIPRNSSGKVDRTRLHQLLAETDPDAPARGSLTEKEAQLKEVWEYILGTDNINKVSNFFDLGGNSLSAIRLVAMARKHNLMLSSKDVFRHPVLMDMAGQCNIQSESNSLCETLIGDGEQQFFAINANLFKSLDNAFLVELAPDVDAQIVQDAVTSMWEHFPGLRTRYAKDKDEQWIKSRYSLEIVPFSMIMLAPDIAPERLKVVVSGFREQLYSQHSPLFNTVLIQFGDKNLLLVRGHYLVCDFVSWQILFDEFFIRLKDKVIFNDKDMNNRYHPICRLPAHLTSVKGRDKNIEALLTIALDNLLASYFGSANYNILLGYNTRETEVTDIIGRYSFLKQLPKLDHKDDIQTCIDKAVQIIATANRFDPMRNNVGRLINLDYLGTTDIRNKPGITHLRRGYLSSQSNQLFPIELIGWVQQDALFVEIMTEKDKAPLSSNTMQVQLSERLGRLVQELAIKGNPS